MISTFLAVSLMAAAPMPAAPQRQQFSSCLRALMNSKLEERMEAAAFETALAAACREQEAAYKAAYIAAAIRAGDSRSVAERDANLEAEDLRTNFLSIYRDSLPQ